MNTKKINQQIKELKKQKKLIKLNKKLSKSKNEYNKLVDFLNNNDNENSYKYKSYENKVIYLSVLIELTNKEIQRLNKNEKVEEVEKNLDTSSIFTFLNDLRNNVVEVYFEKKDGSKRFFSEATLNFDLIPEELHPTSNNTTNNSKIIKMFVISENSWKTIITKNLISWKIVR